MSNQSDRESQPEIRRPQSAERDKPLAGRTILVTRPRSQSADISSRLESLGAIVIHFPTIEIVAPETWDSLDASIEDIERYNWLVFTSANAVNFFCRRLREKRTDGVAALAGRIVCAIGPATAQALEAAGAIATVIASESKGEGALKAILDHVGEAGVSGLSFLIPRAKKAREVLPMRLRSLGAHVDTAEAYQTVKPETNGTEVSALFIEHSIDAITFTSPSTVSNFAEIVGLSDISKLLENTLAACIGPITAETAAKYGLRNIIEPPQYNATALVDSIVDSLRRT